MYLPKSKYNIKETPGDELVVKATREPYAGSYLELSNGQYFAGNNIVNKGPELILISSSTDRRFGTSFNFSRHKILNENTFDSLKKYKQILPFKPQPTEEDYDKRFFTRYYAKRINSKTGYFEISSQVFEDIIGKEGTYDYNLYQVSSIKWVLMGNVKIANKKILEKQERISPGISLIFPTLNEYEKPELLENQLANPGELVYRDNINQEYVGYYHVHPEKGPMEGALHTENPHALLAFKSDIIDGKFPTDDSLNTLLNLNERYQKAYKDYLQNIIDKQSQEPVENITPQSEQTTTSMPSTPSTPTPPPTTGGGGGGYSSGGGGGY